MGLLDDEYFKSNFNTALTPEQETQFQAWAKDQNRLEDVNDYDLRGFWKGQNTFSANGHGSDQFKKPNHPTFSDQSIYNGAQAPWGGQFTGGTWTDGKNGVMFTPTAEMLKYTHPLTWLQQYMQQVEPDVQLNMNRGLLSR